MVKFLKALFAVSSMLALLAINGSAQEAAGDGLKVCPPTATQLAAAGIVLEDETSQTVLSHEDFSVKLSDHTVDLFDSSGSRVDVASVGQLDYGVALSIHDDASGGIIVIGDQTSYRLFVGRKNGQLVFTESEPFPRAYARGCNIFHRIISLCRKPSAFFSSELHAAFQTGYSYVWGLPVTYVYGLDRPRELRLSDNQTVRFVSDLTGNGKALMRSADGRYYEFDGAEFQECKYQPGN